MKINLLPKISIIKRAKYFIVLLIVLLFLTMNVYTVHQILVKKQILNEKEIALGALKENRKQLQIQSERTKKEYEQSIPYYEVIQRLKSEHIDWNKYFNRLHVLLPNQSEITNIKWTNKGTINISCNFESITEISEYIRLLHLEEWIDSVHLVNSEKNKENSLKNSLLKYKAVINVNLISGL